VGFRQGQVKNDGEDYVYRREREREREREFDIGTNLKPKILNI
jgi:hypothetical protein